jgi:hypothetical protein
MGWLKRTTSFVERKGICHLDCKGDIPSRDLGPQGSGSVLLIR